VAQTYISREVQQHPRTVTNSHDRQHVELAGTAAEHPAAPLFGTKRPVPLAYPMR
jgi:hypothetical protein